MPETARPWATTEASLSDLTPFADWDPVVSTILSLRTYLFEHGAVPTWNYMLCGGRPELSVPFSWAYTWPSLFGYSLPPIHAVIAVWIVMTAVGFFSLRGLLRRWGADSLGANTGACLYAFSGCFAARFEAGHISIAFFHLVPLLMLLFEIGFARALAGQPMFGAALMTTLGSFLFMTAGLPHALMHFYPAFLLLVALRVLQTARARGTTRSLRAAAVPVAAHALGLWLAAYKLWPVIRWQLAYPRQRVMFESYSVWEVIRNTLLFVPDYLQSEPLQPWHVYPAWGYNAYVGPVAWLLAAFGAIAVIAKASRTGGGRDHRRGGGLALLLIAIGIALSLGNDSALSPASLFRHFPLLDGIRAFNRYQILIVVGVSTLVAHGLSVIAARRGGRAGGKAVAGALALGALAPVLAQAGLLAWNVPAASRAEILARYPAVDPPQPPQLIGKRWAGLRESGHESALLERGYWIGNCHSDLTLPALRLWLPGGVSKPISWPAPDGLEQLGRNSLTLSYASKGEEEAGEPDQDPVILNLRILESFRFDAPTHTLPDGRTAFYRSDLDGGRLTVTAAYPGPAQGAWATGAGLLACIGFFGLLRARAAGRAAGLAILSAMLCSCAAAPPPEAEPEPAGDSSPMERPARDLKSARVGDHVFHRRLLGNGLSAVAALDRGEGVSVFVIVAAGKRQETPSTTGLAHLVEHAMYTGTPQTGPGEHDRRIGHMGGKSNAFTREDYTLFYDHDLPADELDEVLAMEADRLRNLSFDEAAFYVERERLRREEEETWQPSQVLTELLEAAVFREHPYGAGIIDDQGHTLAPGLDIAQVREFYDRHYRPGSTAVVVAGAIEPERALDAIERAFAPLPPGPAVAPPPPEPAISEPRRVSLPWRLPRDRVEWVWLIPAMGHRDRPALDVLARLLSRRTTSSGAPVLASAGNRVDRDLFRLAATGPSAAQDLEEILRDLLEGRIEAAEVEEVKHLMVDAVARQPLRARPYFSLAATFGVYEALGYTDVLTGTEAAIAELTANQVIRVGRHTLDPRRRVTVHFQGTGAEIEALPQDPGELFRAAEAATQAGDLDRAAAAYTALLALNPTKMNRVIALASRGKLQLQRRDYDGAIRDFEAALEVIDYPDLHDWLDEARALQAGERRDSPVGQ